jgi:predicted metalloprotease with PDZ domain
MPMLTIHAAARAVVLGLVAASGAHAQAPAAAQPPIEYRLSFADHVRHVMDVEAVFAGAPDPLEIHMSRTSPGRYALHEFAKNVFDVQFTDAAGRPATVEQRTLHRWRVRGHGGAVRVRYKVYGDEVDGTYLGVDAAQAHINMPAALLWGRGGVNPPPRGSFVAPPDTGWTVATQLYATSDPLVFTAPNLAYLMDSPAQFTAQTLRTFTVAPIAGAAGIGGTPATIRIALRHDGSDADVDRLAARTQAIVREQQAIFGELPAFEPGHYTFLATFAPGVDSDAMEHRNSTVMTAAARIATSEDIVLRKVAHEFFHAWNVERIRPKSLEPFDFDDTAMASELWVGEGFTQYYETLTLLRTGAYTLPEGLERLASVVNRVNASQARRVRFAPEMSRLAGFIDGGCSPDPNNLDETTLSYYVFGGAIALGLDLELRDRTDGRISLDDYMKALWTKFGRTPGPPGVVATPYTPADLETTLAEVSGSVSFARDVFERYVNGPELVEYGMLLRRMGLLWRPAFPGKAWMGDLPLGAAPQGAAVFESAPPGTPAYDAGLGEGDVIVGIGAATVSSPAEVNAAVDAAKPGDRLAVRYLRQGRSRETTIALRGHPTRALVTRESVGETPTPEELQMRAAWLSPRAK